MMEYRKLPHGEEQISVIGFGTSSIGAAGEKEIEAAMELALDTRILDMLMFSINPAYDYRQGGAFAVGGADERQSLYRSCEAESAWTGSGSILENSVKAPEAASGLQHIFQNIHRDLRSQIPGRSLRFGDICRKAPGMPSVFYKPDKPSVYIDAV